MKLVKKSLLALATAAAMATPAFAALQNQGGIVWDPAAGLDFTGIGVFAQSFILNTAPNANTPNVGDELTGYGSLTTINSNPVLCVLSPGCTLTYAFGGYTLVSGTGPNFPKTFANGWVKFFVDTDAAADNSIAGSSDGTLWASFIARNDTTGKSLNVAINGNAAQSFGVLDIDTVTPGSAGAAFNTNSYSNVFDPLNVAGLLGADASFSNTTTNNQTGGITLNGDTVNIPEPGSLALLGLGLVGLAAARRRKAA